MEFLRQLDISLFYRIYGHNPFPDWLTEFNAVYLLYFMIAVIVIITAVTLIPKFTQYKKRGLELFILAFASSVVSRLLITEPLRIYFNRLRPFAALTGVSQIIEHSAGKSFPSGHASIAFALAAVITFYYPKTGAFFFIAALIMGTGRMQAGVHFPGDILAGAAIGILTAFALQKIYKKIGKEKAV